ncbi:MAG TPA: ECF transporter S component [Candidatus Dormibacteraeota bacterium]|nr:ECF transporter S component [Candidatus Dormibacteraeota bacterium]
MILLLISALGVGLFLWPFSGLGLPAATPALAIGLGALLGLLAIEVGTRRMDSRQLALLAALSAVDAGLRAALVTGIGGFSPIFLLVLCGGYALGPEFGFLLGASSLLVSALVTGGLGPWVPYQLFAVGWVGATAGLAGMLFAQSRPRRQDVIRLAGVGIVTGFAFGALMDIWNWTFYFASPQIGWRPGLAPGLALFHFAKYYLVTSAGYDTFRAGGNAIMVLTFGLPLLAALHRLSKRFRSEWHLEAGPSLRSRPPSTWSAQPADHVAAGHLVVPGLLAPIDSRPCEADEAGEGVE